MRPLQESSRFLWLTSLLSQKKSRIAGLLRRLAIFDGLNTTCPAISEKFMHLLHQIETERDKELDLIYEIQEVEEKHRERRERRELERADPNFEGEEKAIPSKGLWRFLSFFPKFGSGETGEP